MNHDRRFDIIVFGATGFTGELVCKYLARGSEPLRWAIAGRNRDKLERLRSGLGGARASVEIVIADVNDPASLSALCVQTRVVITTVGPYIVYGEPLVAACAEAGTDYVDLTGEPEFLTLMRERYHTRAQSSRARIIHACGFDSTPHDLGAYFTVKALRRLMPVGDQDTLPIQVEGVVEGAGKLSGGTWHSLVGVLARGRIAPPLVAPKPRSGRKLTWLPLKLRYSFGFGVWLVPLPSIDPLVVLLSAGSLDEYGPDFRYGHYLGLRWFLQVVGFALGVGVVYGMAQLDLTRSWLLKLHTPGEGPEEAARAKGWFRVRFVGQAGVHKVSTVVRGGDPGYGDTAKMISEAALCLALDRARLPERFGVVTTAAALGDRLIERLQRAGMVFEELSEASAKQRSAAPVTHTLAHP